MIGRRNLSRALALACVALGTLAPAAGIAQGGSKAGIPSDSIAKLSASLSEKAKAALDRYLNGPDSAASNAIRALASDSTASVLVLVLMGTDTRTEIRGTIARGIPYRPQLAAHPNTAAALRDRIRNDPDTGVVMYAAEALRKVGVMGTGIRGALADRIAASGDAAFRTRLFEADEVAAYAEAGMLAPKFMLAGGGPFAAAPAGKPVRFIAFGDYGTAHLGDVRYRSHQAALSGVMRSYHKKRPFTFGITTGDNFYPTSFPSPEDPSWEKSWSSLYDAMGIPFYISIGNHDWGEEDGPLSQHIYGRKSKSWKFPAFYYTYTAGDAQFFAVNTNSLTERQLLWLKDELSKSTAKWKIVYGHFPTYEQTNYSNENPMRLLVPIFKEHGVDMYLAGHHHTMQHWSVDGVEHIVTGAGGAGNYGLGNDTLMARAGRKFMMSVPGFAVVDVNSSTLTLRFIGEKENVLYEFTRKK